MPRLFEITFQAIANELSHLRRNFIGHHGYQAFASEGDDGQRERVITREHHKIFRHMSEYGSDLSDVAGSFLDSDDVVDFPEPLQHSSIDVCGGSARNAID